MEEWVDDFIKTNLLFLCANQVIKELKLNPEEYLKTVEERARNCYTLHEASCDDAGTATFVSKLLGQEPPNVQFDDAVNKIFKKYKDAFNKLEETK